MSAPPADPILQALLQGTLGSPAQAPGNRVALEDLSYKAGEGGTLDVGVRRFEAASLRFAAGDFVVELGQVVLHELVAQVRVEGNRPRLDMLRARSAELTGVELHGPLVLTAAPHGRSHAVEAIEAAVTPPGQAVAGRWCLGPLAAAEGGLRAKILDAHLLFDADVTVPVRLGRIDFNKATVEHVGPDSRMGVSRLGLYVDAPNGRSYLYQFPSTPVAGVEYERRGALLGPWVTDRGHLHLQAFIEALLGQRGAAPGFTEQARQLLDRTSVNGELQLGDGSVAAPGLRAEMAGREAGRNAVRLHAEAVGRGIAAEVASLFLRNAAVAAPGMRMALDEIAGAASLRLFVEAGQLRFRLELAKAQASGLHLEPRGAHR